MTAEQMNKTEGEIAQLFDRIKSPKLRRAVLYACYAMGTFREPPLVAERRAILKAMAEKKTLTEEREKAMQRLNVMMLYPMLDDEDRGFIRKMCCLAHFKERHKKYGFYGHGVNEETKRVH